MTTIKHIDRNVARLLGEELEKAAQEIAKRYGLQVKGAGGSYMAGSFTAKTEFAVIGENGIAETKDVEAFRLLASSFGLAAEDLGRTFVKDGKKHTICGLRPKADRFPILARREDGKTFKFPAATVKVMLARASA